MSEDALAAGKIQNSVFAGAVADKQRQTRVRCRPLPFALRSMFARSPCGGRNQELSLICVKPFRRAGRIGVGANHHANSAAADCNWGGLGAGSRPSLRTNAQHIDLAMLATNCPV